MMILHSMRQRAFFALLAILALAVTSTAIAEHAQAREYTPGARSTGDSLFPGIGNGGYDAKKYKIELNYDWSTNSFLTGTKTTMTAEATKDLSDFSLDFTGIYSGNPALTVTGVKLDGESVPFQAGVITHVNSSPFTQLSKVIVTPPEGIDEGEEFDVEISYTGTPRQITDPDNSQEGWFRACYNSTQNPTNCDGSFTVNEPVGAQSWFPSNNVPSDKAQFETIVTVDESKTVAGTGDLVSRTLDDGKAIWHYLQSKPTATYLTSSDVGNFHVSGVATYNPTPPTMTETSTGKTIPIYNYIDSTATTTQVNNINSSLNQTPTMINTFSNLFGPYPLNLTGAVVDRTTGVGYALENQGIPHYATLSVSAGTHAHELAHQWYGNNVTLTEWKDIWFNEGWAQWAGWYWTSPTTPASQFTSQYNSSSQPTRWNTPPGTLNNNPSNLFSTFPTYTRGGMLIEGYRQIVGDTIFYDFAKGLTADFAAGNITAASFIAYAKEKSGFTGWKLNLLDSYFQQWIYLAGKPTIVPATFLTAPPVTEVTSGPEDGSRVISTSATFGFTSDRPSATYECQLDGGAWSPCTSTKTYTDLEPGEHTFGVRGTISPQGTGEPVYRTWTAVEPFDVEFDHGLVTFGMFSNINAVPEGEEITLSGEYTDDVGNFEVPVSGADFPTVSFDEGIVSGTVQFAPTGKITGKYTASTGRLAISSKLRATVNLDEGPTCYLTRSMSFASNAVGNGWRGVAFSDGLDGDGAVLAYWSEVPAVTGGEGCEELTPLVQGPGGLWLSHGIDSPPGEPVNISPPELSGTGTVGGQLKCAPGEWAGASSIANQWTRNGDVFTNVNENGKTRTTYNTSAGDIGDTIACQQVATNAAGSVTQASNSLTIAAKSGPVNITPPTLTGTGFAGGQLKCAAGSWQSGTYSNVQLQWTRNGDVFDHVGSNGKTKTTYNTSAGDIGDEIACQQVASKSGVDPTTAASTPITISARP